MSDNNLNTKKKTRKVLLNIIYVRCENTVEVNAIWRRIRYFCLNVFGNIVSKLKGVNIVHEYRTE